MDPQNKSLGNTAVASSMSSSCLPSLCLCAVPRMFLHHWYLSRHQSLTPPLLKINNHSSMFIIAYFHTQPARNNHFGFCMWQKTEMGKLITGGEVKCEKSQKWIPKQRDKNGAGANMLQLTIPVSTDCRIIPSFLSFYHFWRAHLVHPLCKAGL